MNKRSGLQSEDGLAIVVVMFFMLIAGVLVITLTMSSRGASDRARSSQDRVRGTGPVDEGLTTYLLALNSGRIGELNGFKFTTTIAEQMLPAGTVIPNTDSRIPSEYRNVETTLPADSQFTVRAQNSDGLYRFWQIYALVPPSWGTPQGGKVTIYLRGFVADASGQSASKSELVRADIRPGRFSDYQILTDGRVSFGAGATLNGRLHSNGYEDSVMGLYASQSPPSTSGKFVAGEAIKIQSGAVCSQGLTRISAAKGTISNYSTAVCGAAKRENTGKLINLLRVDDTMKFANKNCGSADPIRIQCYTSKSAGEVYDVTLNNQSISVDGFPTVALPAGGGVLIFNQTVRVQGTLTGRATIMAYNESTGTAFGGPGIALAGDTARATVDSGADGVNDSTLGLVAQGDFELITLDNPGACGVAFNGAMASASGFLTVPQQWRSPTPVGAPACAQPAKIEGSYSGHYPPFLSMKYGSIPAGFSTREYKYDSSLYSNPPPLFPTTGPWETQAFKDANMDCFTAGTLDLNKSDCV